MQDNSWSLKRWMISPHCALQIAELGDRNKIWQKETLKHDPEYLGIVIRFGRDVL